MFGNLNLRGGTAPDSNQLIKNATDNKEIDKKQYLGGLLLENYINYINYWSNSWYGFYYNEI